MKGAHTQSDPPRSLGGTGGVAGARRGGNLWRPPPPPPDSLCCRQSERRDGPGHGAAHPWPACLLPCGNPGTARCRGERPPPQNDGRCSLCRRPQPPLNRHHIALSLSNTARAARLAGSRPRPRAPASVLGAVPGLRVRPRVPSLCAPRVRAGAERSDRAWTGACRASASVAEPRCRHGMAVRPRVYLPAGRWERDTKRPAPTGVGAASSPARPAQSQARPQRLAFHGLQYGAGRGGARELGPVPRARGPACVRPGLAKAPSSRGAAPAGRGWHHPGSDRGGPAPALIGLRRGVNCQPMWRGRRRWRLLK